MKKVRPVGGIRNFKDHSIDGISEKWCHEKDVGIFFFVQQRILCYLNVNHIFTKKKCKPYALSFNLEE